MFKSAEELNLNERQQLALVATLNLFETGKVMDVSYEELEELSDQDQAQEGFIFNIHYWDKHLPCGTIRCIGGTADALAGARLFTLFPTTDLEELFHPPDKLNWDDINLPIAAKALRNYLTTGKADWAGAMT